MGRGWGEEAPPSKSGHTHQAGRKLKFGRAPNTDYGPTIAHDAQVPQRERERERERKCRSLARVCVWVETVGWFRSTGFDFLRKKGAAVVLVGRATTEPLHESRLCRDFSETLVAGR